MREPTYPGYWDNQVVSFTITNSTQAKILCDVTPAQVVAAVSGETALPGESAIRQRVLQGGCRIIDGTIASTDSAAKSLLSYVGVQTSLYANMGVVTTTATTNSTVTRNAGSFITDGYQVGDKIMLFGCVTGANNGTTNIVTGVAANTLTVSGTTGIPTAETQGAGFRIIRLGRGTQIAIPANSGNADATPAIKLIGTNESRTDTSGVQLGATGMLIVAMSAAISALPAQIDVSAQRGLY